MTLYKLHKFNTKTNQLIVFVFFFFLVFNATTLIAQNKMYTIMLDAGHGGKDPGNIGYKKYKEKEIALSIVLEVGKILEKNKNIKVVYTRKKDVFVDLWVRGKMANKANADLFVSVHCNAHNTQANGAETWVQSLSANSKNLEVAKKENGVILLEDNFEENYKDFDPKSPESFIGIKLIQEEYLDQSLALASIVQNKMVSDLKRKDRGVKQNRFVVLYQTFMPSILVETGFLTNKYEGAYLNKKDIQGQYAKSISNGILEYIKQVDYNSVSNDAVSEVVETVEDRIVPDVTFKVQIASGGRKLETKSYNFKGLKGIERVKIGKSYKYYFGRTSNFDEVEIFKRQARENGYSTAFVVAFKDGEKISVDEALKTLQ